MEASKAGERCMLFLSLHYSETQAATEDLSRFVYTMDGRILLTDVEDRETEAGHFTVTMVDATGAMDEGVPAFDLFDTSASLFEYYLALYDSRTSDYKRSALTAAGCDYIPLANLLVIDRLFLYPEYRGHGLGLAALIEIVRRHRYGAGLIALKPFPLQFECHNRAQDTPERQRLRLDDFDLTQEKAMAKLRRYYGRLGFKRVPRTEYMVLSPDAVLLLPWDLSDAL